MAVVKNAVPVETNAYIDPHYVSATKDGWGTEMVGSDTIDGADIVNYTGTMGLPITNFTIEGKGIKKARVRNKKGRWLGYSDKFDKTTGLGDGTNITGIEIVGKGFIFAVHLKGGDWMKPVTTSDKEGEVLGGIGTPIDAIWVEKI